ncbi:hypothetical protein ONE63_001955 [Megalurothrips usitatus]|uniref:Phospholipid scramblase n=1 Tax=Megalurothrips usitatus TaxID=439358 RepID=A0AAV7XB02_9NEOP|nr:hypothetical protein ONE63_001955 [Megalurothrips usitatus]
MTARLQEVLSSPGAVLYDVPLPESLPMQDEPQTPPRQSAAGHTNRTFADDVGFDDDQLSETRSVGVGVSSGASLTDYGAVSRAPLPVPTISQGLPAVPFSGLHLLAGLEAVEIQQTVELQDLLAAVESENRYVVRSARGETLLVASECSSEWQRRCVGSSRSLRMRLYDPSRQESLHLGRRLACGAGPCGLLGCCCYLQRLDVLLPPGRPLGSVTQAWTLLVPVLEVRDLAGSVIYRIEGPGPSPWSCSLKEAVFKITSRDGLVELGAIAHMWKPSQSSYITRVIFPSSELHIQYKALLLSAAFLLVNLP